MLRATKLLTNSRTTQHTHAPLCSQSDELALAEWRYAQAAPALTNSSLDVDQKIEGVIARAGIGYKF
jgi:hypothetical protein